MSDQRVHKTSTVRLTRVDPVTAPMRTIDKIIVTYASGAAVACVVGAFVMAGT
jgi:hypothetical protein